MTASKCLSALALAALMAPGISNAATVTFESITGVWSNATGVGSEFVYNYANNGTSTPTVNWGAPNNTAGLVSGYDFASVATPLDVQVNAPSQTGLFDLGAFTHRNFDIQHATGASGVQLTLTAMISVDGGAAFAVNFVYDFVHNETPNWFVNDPDGICANGQANYQGVNLNGCADQITILTNAQTGGFTLDDVEYTLRIAGFEQNGQFVDSWWTGENMSNNATLKADIVARDTVVPTPVPEPLSLAIFGTALLGLGGVVYRRR